MHTVLHTNSYFKHFGKLRQTARLQVAAICVALEADHLYLPVPPFEFVGHHKFRDEIIGVIATGEYRCRRLKDGAECRNFRDWGYLRLKWSFQYAIHDTALVEKISVALETVPHKQIVPTNLSITRFLDR